MIVFLPDNKQMGVSILYHQYRSMSKRLHFLCEPCGKLCVLCGEKKIYHKGHKEKISKVAQSRYPQKSNSSYYLHRCRENPLRFDKKHNQSNKFHFPSRSHPPGANPRANVTINKHFPERITMPPITPYTLDNCPAWGWEHPDWSLWETGRGKVLETLRTRYDRHAPQLHSGFS